MHVYIITNNVNGKYYVGKTTQVDLKRYLREKLAMARRGRNDQRLLFRAMRKYTTEDAWSIESLVRLSDDKGLRTLEIELIASLHARNPKIGYNLYGGGEGGTMSAESRLRLSAARKGKVVISQAQREHARKAMTGNKNALGHRLSDETKRVIGLKGKGRTAWNKGKSVPTNITPSKALLGMHNRWHRDRNLSNPNCEFCV